MPYFRMDKGPGQGRLAEPAGAGSLSHPAFQVPMALPLPRFLSQAATQVAQALREEVLAHLASQCKENPASPSSPGAPADPALEVAVLEMAHVMVCCGMGHPSGEDDSRTRLARTQHHPGAVMVVQAVRNQACLSNFFPGLLDDPTALASANARLRHWLRPLPGQE